MLVDVWRPIAWWLDGWEDKANFAGITAVCADPSGKSIIVVDSALIRTVDTSDWSKACNCLIRRL